MSSRRKNTHRKIELGVWNERCTEQKWKRNKEKKILNEPHAYASELETVKMNFAPKFRGHIFFPLRSQCLNVCGNNVKWFWSQIWIVIHKRIMWISFRLVIYVRISNHKSQIPKIWQLATVATGIPKNAK